MRVAELSSRGVEVRVRSRPDPTLLRAALSARLNGRPFPAGAEDEVAAAVTRAVAQAKERR